MRSFVCCTCLQPFDTRGQLLLCDAVLLALLMLQVVFSLQLSCPAYDGAPGSSRKLSSVSADTPCRAQLGAGQLPPGLEAALCSMSKGEKALFVIPAADMQPEQPSSSNGNATQQQQQPGVCIPQLPAKCAQVEAAIELLDLVQVRSKMGYVDSSARVLWV